MLQGFLGFKTECYGNNGMLELKKTCLTYKIIEYLGF